MLKMEFVECHICSCPSPDGACQLLQFSRVRVWPLEPVSTHDAPTSSRIIGTRSFIPRRLESCQSDGRPQHEC
jgi:hypothetical protein